MKATLTTPQAATAFDAWERDYRANPDTFLTAEETARMELAPLAEQRSICFFAYLRQEGINTECPPEPGQIWEGQGGIYVGIARNQDGGAAYHLILAEEAPTQRMTWADGMAFAKTITADGKNDFALPTRFEAALLYANVRDKLDTSKWHWTGTQSGEGCAFLQYFRYGSQFIDYTSNEGRCRFVRRLVL